MIDLSNVKVPQKGSHKGQNGRLLIIGGSELFHAASLWALTVASRIVDLVHYSSVPQNNELVKHEFRNGIVIPREDIDAYIAEDDAVLIGPGMTRSEETATLTNTLLVKYPRKQWIIDAGALQMMDLANMPPHAIVTPHHGEYTRVFHDAEIAAAAKTHSCIIVLKGDTDQISDGIKQETVAGGNPGMTKGGTGDVLAGLIAALACMNDPWVAAVAGSYINKTAGDELYKTVGPFFNATDLANQIPKTMKELLDL